MTFISTARSINPLDGNPQPFRYVFRTLIVADLSIEAIFLTFCVYRIVLKRGTQYMLVAVADTRDEIFQHWKKLEDELLPTMSQIEDPETLVQFFCAKSAFFHLVANLAPKHSVYQTY